MLDFLKRRLKNQKGSMDTIIVSLLLVLAGITLVASLTGWLSTQTDSIKDSADSTLQKIIDE
jgi:hypothetical protein